MVDANPITSDPIVSDPSSPTDWSKDPVVPPEQIQAQVRAGYQRSGELNQEQNVLTHGSQAQNIALQNSQRGFIGNTIAGVTNPGRQLAAGAQNLAAMGLQAAGFPGAAGNERVAAAAASGYGANPNAGVSAVPGQLIGGAAAFINKPVAALVGGSEALNQDEAAKLGGEGLVNRPSAGAEALHVAGSAALNYALAKVFEGSKVDQSVVGAVEAQLKNYAAKVLPQYAAKYGSKFGTNALANDLVQLGQQTLSKYTTQPDTKIGSGILENSLIGGGIPLIHEALGGGAAPIPETPPAEDRQVLPQENMTAQGGSERPPMPIAETPKETAPSAPQEQVKPPVSTPVETGWAGEKPTLPDNAASMDAGQLRRFANENGVPIDRRIIANKMEKQQMTPRQAMLQYLQERVNPGKTAGLPKMPPMAPENEPGYLEGGLGSGKGHIEENPQPAERGPLLEKKPLPPIPKDFDGWSNRQAREWLQSNGYQPKQGVGRKPMLADAQEQYRANPEETQKPPTDSDYLEKTGYLSPQHQAADKLSDTELSAKYEKYREQAGASFENGKFNPNASDLYQKLEAIRDTIESRRYPANIEGTEPTQPSEKTPQIPYGEPPKAEPFEKGTKIISGGSDAIESSVKAVKDEAPSHAIEPDTFTDKTVGVMKKFLADESGGFDVKKFRHEILNVGHKLKDLAGGIADRAGTAIANFVGGDLGRSFQAKRVINAFRGVTSQTNRGALVRDALYRSYFNKLNGLPVEQQDRLIDELETGQKPSDPFFTNFARMWELDGKSLKKAAVGAKVPGAEYWNESQVGRQAGPLDKKGRAPSQEGYNPPKRGAGGMAPLNLMSRRLTGGRAEFRQAIESQGMAEVNKNPFITALQKRMQAWNYINHTKIAREQLAEGNIRKLEFGEKPGPNDAQLSDKFFNPFPPKMTAEAKGGLLDDLNDHTIPLTKRLALLKEGIADGRIKELQPSSPDAFEHYSSGIHEAPEHTIPGDIYEKFNAQGGTGEYGQTQARKMGGPQAEDHATGEYSPARKGNLPEGHGIVDDALLQAHKPRYVANKDVADLLNSAMEPSPVDPQNPFYRGWTWLNNAILATKFGLSGFHYTNLAMGAAGNRGGAVLQSLREGRIGGTLRAARQAIPGTGTAELIQKGKAFREALESPQGSPLVKLAQNAGGIIEQPKSYEKEPVGNKLSPPNIIRGANKLLFDKYGDNLRRGVMSSALQDIVDQANKDGKGIDHPDVIAKAQKAVQATFDTFDTLRKDKNYQSNAVRIAMKAAFSYPQWQLSKIRQTAQAVRDIPGLLRTGNVSSAQQAVVGNVLLTTLAGGAMTWASTGEPPKDVEDFLHPWLFGRRVVLPGPYEGLISLAYSHGDVARYLENRLVPGLSLLNEYRQGRDYQGQKTTDSITDIVRTAAKEATPDIISKPIGLDQPRPEETPEQQLGDLAGLHRAPKPPKVEK